METATIDRPRSRHQQYAQLSEYAAHIHSIVTIVGDGQLEWYLDPLYYEYTKIRDGLLAISRELFNRDEGNSIINHRRSSDHNNISKSPVPQFDKRRSTGSGMKRTSADDWPLSNSTGRKLSPGNTETAAIGSLRQDLERLIAGHQRWLVEIRKDQNKNFTPEELDSVEWLDDVAIFQGVPVKAIAGSSGKDSPYVDKWEARFRQYNLLRRDLAELEATGSSKRSSITQPRRVILETIAPYGDAILEFAITDDESSLHEQPVLRFRVSSHMLTECSPIFARMFSKHPKLVDTTLDLEQDIPQDGPVPFSESIQLWRMPQIETNKESALTILLHAAHMHNDQVPRTIRYEQLVALSEAAIRYRCSKPLELFFEHCWLHQWIRRANDEMPDGMVTISYAFGRRRLFSRVTKSVILHITDEEELRAKNWPQVVKDKIWAVRSAKMAQVYATCSETIEEYLRRPRAPEAIPVSPPPIVPERPVSSSRGESSWGWKGSSSGQSQNPQQSVPSPPSPVVTEQQQQKQKPTKTKRESWSWKPMSSSKLPPIGSSLRPISRPVILPPPPPPPVADSPRQHTHSIDSTTSGTSNHSTSSTPGVSGIFPELFTFSSVPRCPKGSHWCDATNLGWLLLIYNELRLFSAILGPSALTGLSLSPNQVSSAPPRSLAKVLDALRGMANPPHPVHSGSGGVGAGVCDPVPAFRDAINDIYNSVTGLALQEVDGPTLRQRAGLSMPKLHGMKSVWPGDHHQLLPAVAAAVESRESEERKKEEIFIGMLGLGTPRCLKIMPAATTPSMATETATAGARVFREENICLNIMRYLETSNDLRAVAVLNHRTYNIYKTHENMLMKDVVVSGGRVETMIQLTGDQNQNIIDERISGIFGSGNGYEDELYYFLRGDKIPGRSVPGIGIGISQQQEQGGDGDGAAANSFSSHILLSPDLLNSKSKTNLADDPEAASTRAIRRASSEASSAVASTCCSINGDDDGDGISDSGSAWNLAGDVIDASVAPSTVPASGGGRKRMKSECPSLDITEGLDTAAILGIQTRTARTAKHGHGHVPRENKGLASASEKPPSLNNISRGQGKEEKDKGQDGEGIKSPASPWLEAEAEVEAGAEGDADQVNSALLSTHKKERDSDFYSIDEREAYRILWPDEASVKSGSGSMPRGVSQAFGITFTNGSGDFTSGEGDGDNYTYGYGHGDHRYAHNNGRNDEEEEEEDPGIKYSRDDGSWLALQGVSLVGTKKTGVQVGSRLEAKSLTLMVESNGNNKQLREEFDKRRLTRGQSCGISPPGLPR